MSTFCEACGQTEDKDRPMPYCAGCYYSGAASSHYAADIIDAIEAHGFPAAGWQTGGGCQNLAIALTEAGWDGPHCLAGSIDGLDRQYWEFGLNVMAHPETWTSPRDGKEYTDWEWSGDRVHSCPACAEIAKAEAEFPYEERGLSDEPFDLDRTVEAIVSAVKSAARVIHLQKENHSHE